MTMKRVGNYYGDVTERPSGDGHTIFVHLGPWQQIVAMRNVLCEDGKERTIYTREADTFFSAPGRTRALGHTVTGFVSVDDAINRWTFKATGKHRDLLLPRRTTS